ncbi:hypothetical protein Phpb_03471 [Photorhabdus namnaonensis]|uniref:Uncharacterized protein n=1 Tax=Photorhabdus namnaonensis TaxID=1851568 RepID=A0A1B8YEA1_9GAMM|nr:hypothetical protein Phpb_03471 [Photorhabdus namnaonensis]
MLADTKLKSLKPKDKIYKVGKRIYTLFRIDCLIFPARYLAQILVVYFGR